MTPPEHQTSAPAQSDPEFQAIVDKLLRQKKLILTAALAGLIGAGLYTFFVRPVYEARTTIVLPASSDASSGALGLAASVGLLPSGSGASSSLSMFTAILNSERLLNRLVESSGIEKKDLRKARSVTMDDRSNLIMVKFKDKDSDQALALCAQALAALGEFNEELSLPTKSKRADLLEDKIDEHTVRLRDLELQFQKFAKESKSVPTTLSNGEGDSDSNLFTQRQQLAQLRSELSKLERAEQAAASSVESLRNAQGDIPTDIPQLQEKYDELRELERNLASARATYTEEAPNVKELDAKVETLRGQLRREAVQYSTSFEQGLVRDINEVRVASSVIRDQIRELEIQVDVAPQEATQFERIRRELRFLEAILLELTVQYEQATMEAASDPNRWEVLDQPELADKPVNKRFGLSLSVGLLGGLFAGLCIALVRNPR